MSVVIGIDVGGSTTKIVGFENTIGGKRLIDPIFVRATDPITALYGAFGIHRPERNRALRHRNNKSDRRRLGEDKQADLRS